MSRISFLCVAGISLLFGANAFAQDRLATKEVTVNYSLAPFTPPLSQSHHLNGAGASVVYYTWIKGLGVKMDFQGYGSTTSATGFSVPPGTFPRLPVGTKTVVGNMYTFMAGPQFKRRGKFEPFVEVLAGGAYTTAMGVVGAAPDKMSFALTSGGGFDIHVFGNLSFRPVEIGYLLTRFPTAISGSAANQNSYRYLAGFTLNLGRQDHEVQKP